jgi:hypothetical protein
MQKWEYGSFSLYHRFRISKGSPKQQKGSREVIFTKIQTGEEHEYKSLEDALNSLGLDGWELSGIFAGQIATQYFFKRPIED